MVELMPELRTIERARKDKRAGKAPTTQAGEFVREEIRFARKSKRPASYRCEPLCYLVRREGLEPSTT